VITAINGLLDLTIVKEDLVVRTIQVNGSCQVTVLAITNPEIAAEWHSHKNGKITPFNVSKATSKVYWWECEKGHEWSASVSNRTRRGDHCPYCSGKIATPETCLQTRNPELAKD
jgi:hypothetical protein